jgi:glycosyltransferase involved in cell wall biosynthesis
MSSTPADAGLVAPRDRVHSGPRGSSPGRLRTARHRAEREDVRFVPDNDLPAADDRRTRVVLPSVTQAEAFGVVVLEGTAAGRAPIGSDPPGVGDLVAGAARGGRPR